MNGMPTVSAVTDLLLTTSHAGSTATCHHMSSFYQSRLMYMFCSVFKHAYVCVSMCVYYKFVYVRYVYMYIDLNVCLFCIV